MHPQPAPAPTQDAIEDTDYSHSAASSADEPIVMLSDVSVQPPPKMRRVGGLLSLDALLEQFSLLDTDKSDGEADEMD